MVLRCFCRQHVLPTKATRESTRKCKPLRRSRPDFGLLCSDTVLRDAYTEVVERKFESAVLDESAPPEDLANIVVDGLNDCVHVIPEIVRIKLKSPWISDGYIALRERVHAATTRAERKSLQKALDKLEHELRNELLWSLCQQKPSFTS